jgi:ketosteroid isomerase-like protein
MSSNINTDVQEIQRVRRALQDAVNSRNVQPFRDIRTNDVRAQQVNGPALKGVEALMETNQKQWETLDSIDESLSSEEIRVLGTLAVDWGRFTLRALPNGAEAYNESAGEYLYTYEKDDAGAWKIHRMTWIVENNASGEDRVQA